MGGRRLPNTVALRANPVADNIAVVRGRPKQLFRAGPRQQGIVPVIGIDTTNCGRGVGVFPVHFNVRR